MSVSVSTVIANSKIDDAILWFTKFITQKQKDPIIDFYSGYMNIAEGYKREIFTNAHRALMLETWTESYIGTGIILKCVIDALNAKSNNGFNNIIDYHGISYIKMQSEKDIFSAEDILYRLFISNNIETAFNDACLFYGKRYPELSYLLFIRDCKKYLPVKNSEHNHIAHFNKLHFPTDCLKKCTWDNYNTFLEIHQFVQEKLEDCFNCQISLLDAHSFIWTMCNAPSDFHFESVLPMEDNIEVKTFINKVSESLNYSKCSEENFLPLNDIIEASDLVGTDKP